jgi:hypothetical protein
MNEDHHEPLPPESPNPESEKLWRNWKRHRRSQTAGDDFADRVMTAVTAPSAVTARSNPGLLMRIGNSPWGRIGICSAAMLVGMLPFLYLAVEAKILSF